MDPLTHAALGVTTALAVGPKSVAVRDRVAVGLIAGLLPDADVLLSSPHDPLFSLEFHRHFSHSLLFSPVIAGLAVLGAGAARFGRPPGGWRPLFLPAWAAAVSHIACDLWTSYGVHVGWPFLASRPAFDLVSVVDPLLTLPLVAFAAAAVLRKSPRAALAGLAWVGLYLAVSGIHQGRARDAHAIWLSRQNLPPATRVTVKPSFANILVWRALSDHDGTLQTAAIRCGLGPPRILPGDRQPLFSWPDQAAAHFQLPPESRQARDLERFHQLSDGWSGLHPEIPNLVGDLRYATLPHTIAPLWTIRLDPSHPDSPVQWAPQRSMRKAPWPTLWQLLTGRAFTESASIPQPPAANP
jgi:inner membrane protein